MATALAERKGSELARPLKVLVPLIKQELEAIEEAGISHKREVGALLHEAKDQLEHGEWGGWLDRNFHLSQDTARLWMRLANVPKRDAVTFSNVRSAIGSPQPPHRSASWIEPVREVFQRVNVEALAKERQDKDKEERLMRQLSHQLIDIGYRVLSAKLHPDKAGGSSEAMARLNNVRRILKEAI